MGIKTTGTNINTSEGVKTSPYFRITEYYRTKDGKKSQFPVEYFTDDTKTTPCIVHKDELKKVFTFDISGTIGTDSIEKAAYDAIGAELLAAGLSPESDETGSWVAYS